jgi:Zn-dependent protease
MATVALTSFLNSLFAGFNLQTFLISILVLCVSLSFHERSHAWAAYKLGDDTAYLQGRMSLNPLVHLDLVGSLVFIVSSLSGVGGYGWAKPVPINPTRFNHKHSMKTGIVLTSLAGPLSNLFLSAVSVILYLIVETIGYAAGISEKNVILSTFLNIFYFFQYANLFLAIFNLLPFPPLDGYKVFGAILPNRIYYKIMAVEDYIRWILLGLIIFGRGILSTVLFAIATPFEYVLWWPFYWLFNWIWKITGLA